MEKARLLGLVAVLGREFVRRRMREHAAKLRLYYLALQKGLATAHNKEVDVHWSEALVVEWFKLLRLAPFERAYPVRAAQAKCPRCVEVPGRQGSGLHTESTFPGGWKVRCTRCGEVWLVLESPDALPAQEGWQAKLKR